MYSSTEIGAAWWCVRRSVVLYGGEAMTGGTGGVGWGRAGAVERARPEPAAQAAVSSCSTAVRHSSALRRVVAAQHRARCCCNSRLSETWDWAPRLWRLCLLPCMIMPQMDASFNPFALCAGRSQAAMVTRCKSHQVPKSAPQAHPRSQKDAIWPPDTPVLPLSRRVRALIGGLQTAVLLRQRS